MIKLQVYFLQLFFFKDTFYVDLIVILYESLHFLHHQLIFILEDLLSILKLTFYFIFKVKLCIIFVSFHTLVVEFTNFSLGLNILVQNLAKDFFLALFNLLQNLIFVVLSFFANLHLEIKVDPFIFLMGPG
jgi:hypothetical protein